MPSEPSQGRAPDIEPWRNDLSRDAREVVRASESVADVVASLLLTLFPRAALYRVGGDVQKLILDPAPAQERLTRLRALLFDLAERPEWRRRHLVTREVDDPEGRRLEALLPRAPADYGGGAVLVGPFTTQALADEWGGDHAVSTLSYDVFSLGGAAASDPSVGPAHGTAGQERVWLCDLFDLPPRV